MSASRHLPLRQRVLLRVLNFYPPFRGAGIRVKRIDGGRGMEVTLKQRWWNRNFVGTHFGGSLYAMTDPFYVLLLFERLGWDYVVWNKAARTDFLRPGRGTVRAVFRLDDDEVEAIRRRAAAEGRIEPEMTVEVVNRVGEVVARVTQTLYVRAKGVPKRDRDNSHPEVQSSA